MVAGRVLARDDGAVRGQQFAVVFGPQFGPMVGKNHHGKATGQAPAHDFGKARGGERTRWLGLVEKSYIIEKTLQALFGRIEKICIRGGTYIAVGFILVARIGFQEPAADADFVLVIDKKENP